MRFHSDLEIEDLIDDFIADDNIDSRYYRAACREYDRRHHLTVGEESPATTEVA